MRIKKYKPRGCWRWMWFMDGTAMNTIPPSTSYQSAVEEFLALLSTQTFAAPHQFEVQYVRIEPVAKEMKK